jgi:hypothetical protein
MLVLLTDDASIEAFACPSSETEQFRNLPGNYSSSRAIRPWRPSMIGAAPANHPCDLGPTSNAPFELREKPALFPKKTKRGKR